MLTIRGPSLRLCDGLSRRDFLRIGAIGGFGLSMPGLQRAAGSSAGADRNFGKARRCVMLFLVGGPPQLDTWDMKPNAPLGIRGELQPIATNVPGIQISQLFPQLARQADKYSILRSLTHQDTVHTSAGYTMLTGVSHPLANSGTAKNIRPLPDDHPHIGSILAKVRGAPGGVPPFVSMPEVIRDDAVNEYPGQDAGFLGKQYSPFRVEADPQQGVFQIPDILLPQDITGDRLEQRGVLLKQLDERFRAVEQANQSVERDAFYEQAFAIIRSAVVRSAFELEREPERNRESYGSHLFGRGCLLARRLLEAGISLVTVYWHYEGPKDSPVWDTHQNNFPHLKNRLMPPTDQAFSRLLVDLSERGMLDDTLVVCMGEFGRTPKINRQGGRDHWPYVQSVVMAGAGIHGGSIYGASDRIGGYPADLPVSPADLSATMLHLLGIPPDAEFSDRTGRPVRASQGTPIQGLFA